MINLFGLLLVDMESPSFIFIYQIDPIFLSVKGDGLKEFRLNLDGTTSTKLRRKITNNSLFSVFKSFINFINYGKPLLI
ncbi:hypothetical protein, partial [Bacillus safensis]|uniref:hypothetical protein n=1 Tax=Bacillus safensis TaxID=561879 RepID=UPI002FFEDD71